MKAQPGSESARDTEPLISVIIPVYNAAPFLPACLDSVLGQSLDSLEVILINDGSTDASPDICEAYARRDNRVQVLHQENLGQSAARNAGLDIAMGRYIGFVDADDQVRPDFYETLYGLLRAAPPYSIAVCSYDILSEDGARKIDLPASWQAKFSVAAQEAYPYLVYPDGYECYIWNKLCDRAFFDGDDALRFQEDVRLCEERVLMAQLLTRANTLLFTNAAGYLYRFRKDSITTNRSDGSPLRALAARRRLLPYLPPAYADFDGAMYTNLLAHAICKAAQDKDSPAFAALREEYLDARRKYARALRRWRRHSSASTHLLRFVAWANITPVYALLRLLKRE